MAQTNRIPTGKGAIVRGITCPSTVTDPPKGKTAKATTAVQTARKGAKVCKKWLALGGIKSSLSTPLAASARLCTRPIARMPQMSARLAPMRSCMSAACLRSTQPKMRPPMSMTMVIMNTVLTTAAMSWIKKGLSLKKSAREANRVDMSFLCSCRDRGGGGSRAVFAQGFQSQCRERRNAPDPVGEKSGGHGQGAPTGGAQSRPQFARERVARPAVAQGAQSLPGGLKPSLHVGEASLLLGGHGQGKLDGVGVLPFMHVAVQPDQNL